MATPEDSSEGRTPFPLAILLCDLVITEAGTNKKTLVGIFDRVLCAQFSTERPGVSIFTRLTDALGHYTFRIDYVQVQTDEVLAQGYGTEVEIRDPTQAIEVVLRLPPVPIPAEGQYEFRLRANNRYVGRVTFEAASKGREGAQT